MKQLIIILLGLCTISSCTRDKKYYNADLKNVIYAGARSSSYGIRPFPDNKTWLNILEEMKASFPGSDASAIWIVGELKGEDSCRLYFPANGENYEYTHFEELDKHESYLTFFDQNNIKVFLQVEPGKADVEKLIDLVLNRYKHHSSVIGFGVDVEWYDHSDRPGWGIPVNDSTARIWEEKVKSHNQNYNLFLKHWDREWMPPNYRGEIIFVSDSQIFDTMSDMVDEFDTYWADYFYPNMVMYQVGYPADKKWWSKLSDPPKNLGDSIADRVKQNCGIFWVDFTLKEVFMDE